MLKSLFTSLQVTTSSNDLGVLLNQLETSDLALLAPLFLEAK